MRLFPIRLGCVSLCLLCAAIYAGEQKFWDKQDAASWTPQQITQFTTASPWAKQVRAVLISNDSNMAASAPRSGGGGRRGRSSGGEPSGGPSPDTLPNWQALVRWASAKPMQQLLKAHLPENFRGHYVISVSGLPISGDNTELAEHATLQVKRGESIHPESAYQDPADTSTLYFAFLPSTLDTNDGKTAVFNMLAAPYEVRVKFNLAEMKYLGSPAF